MNNRLLYVLLMIIISSSCVKEDFSKINESFQWNPEFSASVGYSTLTLTNNYPGFDSTQLDYDFITQFPDWAIEEFIILQDTVNFNFSSSFDETEYIEKLLFRLNSWNSFPVNTDFNLYFAESSYVIVDSINVSLEPGAVNNEGEVILVATKTQDFTFEKNRIENLGNVNFIILVGEINNFQPDTSFLKYYPDCFIKFQLGVQAKLSIEISGS
ncbi:hypothetical protein ES708_08293 [subsurface metagenome]